MGWMGPKTVIAGWGLRVSFIFLCDGLPVSEGRVYDGVPEGL